MKQKLKTKKAAAKRFKITGTGKVMVNSAGRRHLLEKKRKNGKRQKRKYAQVSPSDINKIKACLPGVF